MLITEWQTYTTFRLLYCVQQLKQRAEYPIKSGVISRTWLFGKKWKNVKVKTLLQIMSFQSQAFEVCTLDEQLRRSALDTSVIKCYNDVVILTSRWNKLVVWPTKAKCSKSIKPHHPGLYTENRAVSSNAHVTMPCCTTCNPAHGNITVTFNYRRVKNVAT